MSPPGPPLFKCSNMTGRLLLFFLLAQEAGTVQGVVEVKVGSAPIVDPGARRAKLYGSTSAIYSPATRYPRYALTTPRSDACKRSYKRALRRARNSNDHSMIYRGRLVQLGVQDDRPPRDAAVPGSHLRSSVLRPVRPHGHRLRVISHNIGGMDTVAYDSLMNWLQQNPCDILLLQEIHHGLGKTSSQWTSGGWHVITSVHAEKRFQGVAVFINANLIGALDIKYVELVAGRLLHVRFPLSGVYLDVLNLYQHTWSGDNSRGVLEQRSRVWNSLSSCLQGLPRRNILLLAGDVNTSLLHEPGVAGGGCLRHDNPPSDSHLLAELSSQQGLCAVNTWCCRKSVDMHTYERGEQRTQIDYIFLRRMHADSLARRTVPTRSLNLTPWRHGARHMALKLSMPVHPG